MSKNIFSKLNTGLTPEQFVHGMEQNQDAFQRWSDSFTWKNKEDQRFFQSFRKRNDLHCCIIAADWCGDVIRNVPVVFHAWAEAGIDTEVLIIEQNYDLIDQFLTMGGRAIPIVILTNKEGEVLGQWAPRPQHVQQIMVQFKQKNPDSGAPGYQEKINEVRTQMQEQYGEGTEYQEVIITELRELLATV